MLRLPGEQELRKSVVFINNMVAKNSDELYPLNTLGNFPDLSIQAKSRDSVFKYFSLPLYNGPILHAEIPVLKNQFISFSLGS